MISKVAHSISYIINPFVISLAALVALTQNATDTTADSVKWMLLIILLCILPLYIASIIFVRSGRMDAIFNNPREQRTPIYVTGIICAAIALSALVLLEAPTVLLAAVIASIIGAVLFLLINMRWKISVHTASVASFAVLMVILFGWISALIPLVLTTLVGWSRLTLKQHTFYQVIAGALVSVVVFTIIFALFDII